MVPALDKTTDMGAALAAMRRGANDMPAKDSGLLGRWPSQAHHSLAQSSMSGCTGVAAPERCSPARLRRSITLYGALQKARQPQSDSPGSG